MKTFIILSLCIYFINARKETPDFINSIAKSTRKYTNNLVTETHFAQTLDNVELKMFRFGKHEANEETRPVVFMQHGLGSSSDLWILTQNQSLAYTLFDLGYDIWLGNFRGNQYSKNDTTIEAGDIILETSDFWDHSFYEMAVYDLPAQLNYVLNYTGAEKLHYFGHSMGTLTMFLALDLFSQDIQDEESDPRVLYENIQPESYFDLSDKIHDFHAMGPVWNLKTTWATNSLVKFMNSDFGYFSIRHFIFRDLLYKLPFGVKPDAGLQSFYTKAIKAFSKILGSEKISSFFGLHLDNYPQEFASEILTHGLQTTSFKNIYHFTELAHFNKLAKYGYQKGRDNCSWRERNFCFNCFECREKEESRVFDLSGIQGIKLFIYSGGDDSLSNPQEGKNVMEATKDKNVVDYWEIPGIDHMGLCADKKAPELIWPKIIERLQN